MMKDCVLFCWGGFIGSVKKTVYEIFLCHFRETVRVSDVEVT